MADIEPTAEAWMGAVKAECPILPPISVATVALQRALLQIKINEQELADYKQQVSDEVEKQARTVWDIHCRCGTRHPISFNTLSQFIIPAPKPDPLFDVMWDLGMADNRKGVEFMAARINEALTARGLEIREKNDG